MTTALVLPGGGGKGAFQAGAEEALRRNGYDWDVILGTSVGALNGAMLATGQPKTLKSVWFTLSEDQVQSGGPSIGRAIQLALGWKRSVYDLDPLKELIDEHLADTRTRVPFYAGVVDLVSGDFTFNPTGQLTTDVFASATMPLIWEPVEGRYVDGGLRDIAPLRHALSYRPDEIVVLLNSPLGVTRPYQQDRIWDDAQRTLDLLTDEIYKNDIEGFRRINRLLNQTEDPLHASDGRAYEHVPLTVIGPDRPLGDTLDFSAETARRLWKLGRDAARKELG